MFMRSVMDCVRGVWFVGVASLEGVDPSREFVEAVEQLRDLRDGDRVTCTFDGVRRGRLLELHRGRRCLVVHGVGSWVVVAVVDIQR